MSSTNHHTDRQTRLPNELIEHILSMLWTSTLSVQDQRTLLTSIPLVSHNWNTSFRVVQRLFPAPKELHIVSQRQAFDFVRLLRKASSQDLRPKSKPKFNPTHNPCLNEIESISIIVSSPRIVPFDPHTFPKSPPMSAALSELLLGLSHYSHRVPALRMLRIDFWNIPLEEAIDYSQLRYWPSWVKEVQFRFGVEEGTEGGLRGGVELKRCGGGSEGFGYGYASQLDEALRHAVSGVRKVTLVDATRDAVMHVFGLFRNARMIILGA
jgi:hypothetical protein